MKNIVIQSRTLFFSNSLVHIFLGSIFLFLCAQAQIPLKPVPITLQTAGILIIALCYNKREALSSVLTYITFGAFGLPVFSNFSGGIGVLTSTTGGYIAGFVLCIYIVTSCREKFGDNNIWKLSAYGIVGSASTLVCGVAYLSSFVGFEKAIQLGFLPFIIPGIAKALFVAASVRIINKNIS